MDGAGVVACEDACITFGGVYHADYLITGYPCAIVLFGIALLPMFDVFVVAAAEA